jgi:hypothetical protein
MKWRNISENDIKDSILNPEKTEHSVLGRKNAFKHVGRKWIKVTFKEEKDIIIVITAIDKAR